MTDQIKTSEDIANNILKKITNAKDILIVCSKPVDPDSIGTALACQLWLRSLGKQVRVVNSFRLPENMKSFPGIVEVTFLTTDISTNSIDLIVTVDASSWTQLFESELDISKLDKEKIVNIDHHTPGEVAADIPDFALRTDSSSAAEVLYQYFLKGKVDISTEMATYLYLALVGDTGNLKWGIKDHTLEFEQALRDSGADLAVVEEFFKPSAEELAYSKWAHESLIDYQDIGAKLLIFNPEIDAQATKLFGTEYWNDFNGHFVYTYFETVDPTYDYLITLMVNSNNKVRLSWRTRNTDHQTLEVMNVAKKAGFIAGGHRNAGGGSMDIDDVNLAKEKLIEAMREEKNTTTE